jgi:hypothetical protein
MSLLLSNSDCRWQSLNLRQQEFVRCPIQITWKLITADSCKSHVVGGGCFFHRSVNSIQFNSIQFLYLTTFEVILDKKNKKNYNKLFRTEQINTLAMSKIIGLCKIIKISFVESSMLWTLYKSDKKEHSGIRRWLIDNASPQECQANVRDPPIMMDAAVVDDLLVASSGLLMLTCSALPSGLRSADLCIRLSSRFPRATTVLAPAAGMPTSSWDGGHLQLKKLPAQRVDQLCIQLFHLREDSPTAQNTDRPTGAAAFTRRLPWPRCALHMRDLHHLHVIMASISLWYSIVFTVFARLKKHHDMEDAPQAAAPWVQCSVYLYMSTTSFVACGQEVPLVWVVGRAHNFDLVLIINSVRPSLECSSFWARATSLTMEGSLSMT